MLDTWNCVDFAKHFFLIYGSHFNVLRNNYIEFLSEGANIVIETARSNPLNVRYKYMYISHANKLTSKSRTKAWNMKLHNQNEYEIMANKFI
jgi:hypothetical protein